MNRGSIVTIILIFGMVFLILLGGLLGFILLQMRYSAQRIAWHQSLYIAESGTEYYKWCLNNGANCDTEKEYFDSQGVSIGRFNLMINQSMSCGETMETNIYSTGKTNRFPDTKREINVVYGRISVAKFAYLLNDNVWAGPDREINGLYHSNGGIRMDGKNQSTVSSSLPEWLCTDSFGCSPSVMKPGVFTTTGNANEDLFEFPVPVFDFDGITVDLAKIKSKAQLGGVYLPRSTSINRNGNGYHLIFKDNGTVEVRIITSLYSDYSYNEEEGWHYDYFRIKNESYHNTYTINPSCSTVFAEDNIWIEGTVNQKVTVASANLIQANKDTSAVIIDDIGYVNNDGTNGFSVIAENNILISPSSPNQLELRGVFIAQKGHFGRNHYPNNFRDKLTIIGSVVSNGRVGTQWTSGSYMVSGYAERENVVDTKLIYSPCPFIPFIEYDFKVIKWEEI